MTNKITYTAGDRTPYTYLIGWSEHNIWYYGSRTAKNCHPSDLWVKYFTSSDDDNIYGKPSVKTFRKLNGDPDVIIVRKVFNDAKKCVKFENKVLRRIKAVSSPLFLNKSDSRLGVPFGKTMAYDRSGKKLGYIECDHPDLISGKVITWGNIVTESGLTNNQINGLKVKSSNSSLDENGLTGYQKSAIGNKVSKSKVGEDGLTGFQRASKKTKEANSKIGEDGLTGYQRAAKKALDTKYAVGEDGLNIVERTTPKVMESNRRVGEDGLTGYQRAAKNAKVTKNSLGEDGLTSNQRGKIKERETKEKIGEDGLNGYQRHGKTVSIIKRIPGEDGLNSYQRAGLKKKETYERTAKKYDVLHIDGTVRYRGISQKKIKAIYNVLFDKRDEQNYLGSSVSGLAILKKNNKLDLFGLYIQEVI
jgi:hypothetical protein